jgi:hypothetical protein
VDCKDELYNGINLTWDYQEKWVDASVNRYVDKLRQRFNQTMPIRPQHIPYKAPGKVYDAAAQAIIPEKVEITQQVVGACVYYGGAVDDTIVVPQYSYKQTSTDNQENHGEDNSIVGLPCNSFICQDLISLLSNDTQHSFRCIISIRTKSKEQTGRIFCSKKR